MLTVSMLYTLLCEALPRELSASWDNDGLMLTGDPTRSVSKILFALDVTPDVAAYAEKIGADLILSHHPMIFKGLRRIDGGDPLSKMVVRLIRANISVMSFHTRLDAAEGGVNSILAEDLSLSDTERFGPVGEEMGIVGNLPSAMPFDAFCAFVKSALGAPMLIAARGNVDTVKRVAVLGGSGRDFIEDAMRVGADVFVTGEAGYHPMTEASRNGLAVIEAGHYYTEIAYSRYFERLLRDKYPALTLCRYEGGCELSFY